MERLTGLVQEGLEQMGLEVPPGAARELCRYGGWLLEKNRVMNLTAITEPVDVAHLHMLDSAALLCVPGVEFEGKRLLDVGTGAGFPGMVLKVLCPSLKVVLLDSLQKRLDWLEEVCGALGLEGIEILHARAEEQAHCAGFRDGFERVVSRAVAPLELLVELCLPFVKVGGVFLAMKAIECEEEISRAAGGVRQLGGALRPGWEYRIPGTDVFHRVVVIEKVSPTPKGFPRRWAKMQKAPL